VATKGQVMRKGAPLRHRAAVPELGVGAMGVGVRGYVVVRQCGRVGKRRMGLEGWAPRGQ
jgi:hypothetical protein